MKIPPQVRPAGRLAELRGAICRWRIELGIALVGIGLEDAAGIAQVGEYMLLLPVCGEFVGDARWRLPAQGRWSRT
jgi:hypothetical protein